LIYVKDLSINMSLYHNLMVKTDKKERDILSNLTECLFVSSLYI